MVDGKMESICTGTIVGIDIIVGVGASGRIVHPIPCVPITSGNRETFVSAIVKSEIQSVHTCAAGARLAMVISIGTRDIVCGAIPVIAVAGGDVVCVIVLGADSEMQRVCA